MNITRQYLLTCDKNELAYGKNYGFYWMCGKAYGMQITGLHFVIIITYALVDVNSWMYYFRSAVLLTATAEYDKGLRAGRCNRAGEEDCLSSVVDSRESHERSSWEDSDGGARWRPIIQRPSRIILDIMYGKLCILLASVGLRASTWHL